MCCSFAFLYKVNKLNKLYLDQSACFAFCFLIACIWNGLIAAKKAHQCCVFVSLSSFLIQPSSILMKKIVETTVSDMTDQSILLVLFYRWSLVNNCLVQQLFKWQIDRQNKQIDLFLQFQCLSVMCTILTLLLLVSRDCFSTFI